jgi:lysyl-tRNA synthetase class 2
LHHPEFTMLEWYRANEPYEALMADCAAVLAEAAKAAGSLRFEWKGRSTDPYAAPERLSVADAFEKFAGIDLMATLDGGEGDREKLGVAARKAGVQIADDDT